MSAASSNSDMSRAVRRTTRVGLVVNLLLSLFKFVVGIWAQSQACVADAVHSLSDSVTDVAVIVGVGFWSAPADTSHPHGHRRIETLVTLFIGCTLGVVGGMLAWRAVRTIGVEHTAAPGWPVLLVAVVSVIVKEWLYRWTAAVGTRCHSPSLVANAWHHRSDALSSVPVAVAAILARLWPGLLYVDHIAAVLVSAMLLKAAWDIAWPSLQELADAGVDEGVRRQMLELSSAVPGVREVHRLRTRQLGPGFAVDLHVLVDPEMSVRRGHQICDVVRNRLVGAFPKVIDVLVHLEPYEAASETRAGGLPPGGAV